MQKKKKMHDDQNIYILYKDRMCHVEPSWSLKEKKKSIILILDFCTLLASPKPHPWEAESGFEPKATLMVLCLSLSLASVRRGVERPVFYPQFLWGLIATG